MKLVASLRVEPLFFLGIARIIATHINNESKRRNGKTPQSKGHRLDR